MLASARRRGFSGFAAGCLILTLWWQSSLAKTPAPQGADASAAKGVLEEWDQSELTLRQGVWRLYAGSLALGKDGRGRTVDDDLTAWIMSADIRVRLQAARGKAEHQQKAGDTDSAHATWLSAKAILDEQAKRLAVIGLYWWERIPLERQRALWLTWVDRAPDDVAKASKERINGLVNQLTADFAPTDGFRALSEEITQLKIAYDTERQRLAALVSARQFAAGESIGSRDRSIPCAQTSAPERADADKQERSDAAAHSPKLLESPAAEKFYPAGARRDSISGDVILQVTVSAEGCMKHVELASSSGAPELDEGAMQLVEYATFRPAEAAGRPVEAVLKMKYHFDLDDAATHVTRGNTFMDRGDYDQAITELDRAVGMDPDTPNGFADRGMAYMWKGQDERARADLDAAYALDPHNIVVFRGRGMLALHAGNTTAAIAAFTEALAQRPHDKFALYWRADAYHSAGDLTRAVLDTAEVIRIDPTDITAYIRQALFLRALHRLDESLQVAEAVMTANPGNASAALAAGSIYASFGKPADARRAFDRAIEFGAGATAFLERARIRPRADLAGRRADIDSALERSPNSDQATVLLADLQAETGDNVAAMATLDAALVARPDDDILLTRRAIAHLKTHQDSAAAQDLDTVAKRARGNPHLLNELCWSLATAGVALERALQACNEAVAAAPEEPAYLDSLGFVLLELGRNAEALAAYNHALQRRDLFPSSLYGRGIARRRQGDRTGGDADVAAASMMDARLADTFTHVR